MDDTALGSPRGERRRSADLVFASARATGKTAFRSTKPDSNCLELLFLLLSAWARSSVGRAGDF